MEDLRFILVRAALFDGADFVVPCKVHILRVQGQVTETHLFPQASLRNGSDGEILGPLLDDGGCDALRHQLRAELAIILGHETDFLVKNFESTKNFESAKNVSLFNW